MDYNKLISKDFKEKELKEILTDPLRIKPDLKKAIEISRKYSVALHPRFLFYWNELSSNELISFLESLKKLKLKEKDENNFYSYIPVCDKLKRNFEKLAIEHVLKKVSLEDIKSEKEVNLIVIDKLNTQILLSNLGLDIDAKGFNKITQKIDKIVAYAKENLSKNPCEILSANCDYEIRDKGGSYIGARMGRPEKAKMRKQFNDETRSHGLFPVGDGEIVMTKQFGSDETNKEYVRNRLKNLVVALKTGYVEENFRTFYCSKCDKETIYPRCEKCSGKTVQLYFQRYGGERIFDEAVEGILSKIKRLIDLTKENAEYEDSIISEFLELEAKIKSIIDKKELLGADIIEKLKFNIYAILLRVDHLKKTEELERLTYEIRSFYRSVYYKKVKYDLKDVEKELRRILGPNVEYPKHVKGISETINKHHTTEHICKSFLRALNNVFVNKDGTVRFDMIEMGLTHFKPKEIGTSIEKLKELGYTHDYHGNPLENDDQILEIFPQDVILPDCKESGDEFASDFVINTGKFVDDLLEKLYGMERFYNFKTKEDTIGHLLIGLAPHTSAGIVGRIIGYSNTQGCFSHPVWHAAQRRNLDGDENGVMLLLDGLINFSREYLPDRRGSRTMDVSLVLTSHLYLDQIDDEVHGMDIVPYYPLEFYQAAKEYASPKAVKIEKVDKRLDETEMDKRYLGYKFTHDTGNMNHTVMCSSYKSVPSMTEKMDLQLGLGKKIRAVDENMVGSFIIDKHFMKDIKGNLRKFSMQSFRCTKCNTIFRRPPLVGKCTNCGNASINFTISEGSIKKYLDPSFKIINEYEVDPYIVETLELVNLRIEGVFGKQIKPQKNLNEFFK